jgi:hypothetical protein
MTEYHKIISKPDMGDRVLLISLVIRNANSSDSYKDEMINDCVKNLHEIHFQSTSSKVIIQVIVMHELMSIERRNEMQV